MARLGWSCGDSVGHRDLMDCLALVAEAMSQVSTDLNSPSHSEYSQPRDRKKSGAASSERVPRFEAWAVSNLGGGRAGSAAPSIVWFYKTPPLKQSSAEHHKRSHLILFRQALCSQWRGVSRLPPDLAAAQNASPTISILNVQSFGGGGRHLHGMCSLLSWCRSIQVSWVVPLHLLSGAAQWDLTTAAGEANPLLGHHCWCDADRLPTFPLPAKPPRCHAGCAA